MSNRDELIKMVQEIQRYGHDIVRDGILIPAPYSYPDMMLQAADAIDHMARAFLCALQSEDQANQGYIATKTQVALENVRRMMLFKERTGDEIAEEVFFNRYPGVKKFLDDARRQVRDVGGE